MIAAAFVRNFSQTKFDFDAMDSAGGDLSGNSLELYCHTNVDFKRRSFWIRIRIRVSITLGSRLGLRLGLLL